MQTARQKTVCPIARHHIPIYFIPLCHARTLHITPHNATPCYATPRHATPHYSKPRHTTPYHTKPHRTTPNHATPHYTTAHRSTPHTTTPRHHTTTSRYTTPYTTTQSPIPSCPTTPLEGKWDIYLKRLDRRGQDWTDMLATSQSRATVYTGSGIEAVSLECCSFTDFWRQYHYVSGGRNGGRKLQRRREPTILLVRPCMPRLWGRRGHEKRAAYCQVPCS